MTAILKWFVGPIAGPVLGGIAAALLLGFLTTVIVYHSKLSDVTTERDQLRDEIYNPSTGYLARNTQCETNVEGLRGSIQAMAGDVKKLADDTKANDANVRNLMTRAIALAGGAKASADRVLSLPAPAPIGSVDACVAGARILKTGAP